MLLAAYHILKDKQQPKDSGSNYFTTMNSEKIKNRNIRSLQNLGFEVILAPQD
jgi:hypothetical protein